MNVNVDISIVVLKTERLVLRPFQFNDLADFYEYARVDGVGQMAGWSPHKNIEETEAILKRFVEGKKTFALVYHGKVIGSLGIEMYKEADFPEFEYKKGRELGFVLSKDYWGLGLMPEAVKEVIRYCFNDLDLDFLICGHFVENRQSQRVQEKCGFQHYKKTNYETRYGEIKESWLSLLERES